MRFLTLEHLRFKYMPRLAMFLTRQSVINARRKLRGKNIRVLVDTNILGKAVTHESAWISTGSKKWGDRDVETGHMARIPVHARDCDSKEYRSIKYLAGIVQLAREGVLSLFSSAELDAEQDYQPIGRYRGYGYFDFNLFKDISIPSIDGYAQVTLGPSYLNLPSCQEQQHQRIRNYGAPLFEAIYSKLDHDDSNDAWHIATAERHDLFCFLTMDFKLKNKIRARLTLPPFSALKTRIMTPEEFGKEFNLIPMPPVLFSYNDASFFVRPDLHWENNTRQPPKRKKK